MSLRFPRRQVLGIASFANPFRPSGEGWENSSVALDTSDFQVYGLFGAALKARGARKLLEAWGAGWNQHWKIWGVRQACFIFVVILGVDTEMAILWIHCWWSWHLKLVMKKNGVDKPVAWTAMRSRWENVLSTLNSSRMRLWKRTCSPQHLARWNNNSKWVGWRMKTSQSHESWQQNIKYSDLRWFDLSNI